MNQTTLKRFGYMEMRDEGRLTAEDGDYARGRGSPKMRRNKEVKELVERRKCVLASVKDELEMSVIRNCLCIRRNVVL